MNRKFLALVSCFMLVAGLMVYQYDASADTYNKKTVLTTNQPLRVPGVTLPPGKYVFKLADSGSSRNIVQVLNEDETQVYATILALPNRRLQPAGDNQFAFWETPKGSPQALRSWFYPGDSFGQEFAYPKSEAAQLAAQVKQEVPAISDAEMKQLPRAPAKVGETASIQPAKRLSATAQAGSAAPESAALEQPSTDAARNPLGTAQQSAPVQESSSLPKTASPYPLLGLIGLLALGAGYSFRMLRNRFS